MRRIERAMTLGRHDIVSPISGETVTEAIWGYEVENPSDIAGHRVHFEKFLVKDIDAYEGNEPIAYIVYVTGLTHLTVAVTAAFMTSKARHVVNLFFAMFNPLTKSYDLFAYPSGVQIAWSSIGNKAGE